MGQKGQILTLLKSNLFQIYSLCQNSKQTIFFYNFFKHFVQLLILKNIFVINFSYNCSGNQLYLNFNLYFGAKNLKKKKLTTLLHFISLKAQRQFDLHKLFLLINSFFYNNIVLKFRIFNKAVNNKVRKLFFNSLKEYKNILFLRRFYLFMDFLNIITLLVLKKISIKLFLYFLCQIFKYLTKRSHNRFFYFIMALFKLFLQWPSQFEGLFAREFKGLKLVTSGKLSGKTRSTSLIIKES